MNSLMQTAGWSVLGWLWASVIGFIMSIGLPGLVVLVTGGILLAVASVKTLKFLQNGKGMSVTAAVMFAALAWMWLMQRPAGVKTRPIAPANLTASGGKPSPILAAKPARLASVIMPPPELRAMRAVRPAQSPPVWWGSSLLAEAAPVAMPYLTQLPTITLSAIHEAKAGHAPAHHSPAPAANHATQHATQHAVAAASPSHATATGPRPGHTAGGSSQAFGSHGSRPAMPGSIRMAQRQQNFQYLGQMGGMIQHQMNGFMNGGMSHHPMAGHMGGHAGGHMGGMSHHGGHH